MFAPTVHCPLHRINFGNIIGALVTTEPAHKRHAQIIFCLRVGTLNSLDCVLDCLAAHAEVVLDVVEKMNRAELEVQSDAEFQKFLRRCNDVATVAERGYSAEADA